MKFNSYIRNLSKTVYPGLYKGLSLLWASSLDGREKIYLEKAADANRHNTPYQLYDYNVNLTTWTQIHNPKLAINVGITFSINMKYWLLSSYGNMLNRSITSYAFIYLLVLLLLVYLNSLLISCFPSSKLIPCCHRLNINSSISSQHPLQQNTED